MSFYAKYPATSVTPTGVSVVEGRGTAGSPVGGVLTVQGDPSGTPIPISGSITASNDSIGSTGAAVPAKATYVAGKNAGNLVGIAVDSSGDAIIVGAGTAGTPAGGVVSIQGVASGTVLPANVTQFGSSAVATGTGTGGAGIPRVTVSSDSSLTSVGTVTTVTGVTTVSTVTSVTNVAAQAIWTTATAAFQAEGNVAFGSITNSYVTLFTPTAATKILQMRNNMNASVSVSLDAGSTTNYILDAGDTVSLDLLANGLNMGATAIQVKYTVGAPTSGSFRINGAH